MTWLAELAHSGASDKQRSYDAIPLGTRAVLDVGCGSGDDVMALAERLGSGALVVGIDSSFEAIDEALRKARNVALNVRFAVGDARCLPFGHDSFEAVWADGVFGAVCDAARVARELTRVIRVGGHLLIRDREAVLVDRGGGVLGLLERCGLGSVSITDAWPDPAGERQLSVLARRVGDV